jgi:outer membrane receptor protein involved in Fe transport
MKDAEEPMLMLTDYWKINSKVQLNTTVAYQTGKIGNSRLDYLVDNPDPVYYRKLPSYWLNHHNAAGVFDGNSSISIANAKDNYDKFLANPQIDWKDIYLNVNSGPGNLSGEGKIVQYEDRNDENLLTFNTNLATQISDNVFMNGGINYQISTTKNFKKMLDLLGANYFKDLNYFGYGDQQQSDLNNPNRLVYVGDKYGYNYNIDASRLDAFTQFKFVYKKVDFYLAQSFSRSVYQREGLYKNGYNPTNSYGRSQQMEFDNFGFKGGLTYKLSGRHFIDFNGIYMSKAPNHKDVFPNARSNNDVTNNIGNETIKGIDLSYIIKAPKFKARLSGYFNEILNQTDINFYYSDGVNAFVSEIVTGINKKNRGGELGLEWQATPTLKFTGVAAYGEYTITNNPTVDVKDDANSLTFGARPSNLEGYKQVGMPQQAFSAGIEYRDPKFWWIGVNANYIAENYIDVSVIKRSSSYYEGFTTGAGSVVDKDLAAKYLEQEKFAPLRLVNLVGGKSWRIQGKYTIGLFANVNNVFNVSYKTGGFEQSRNGNYQQDYQDHQSSNGYSSFGSKYFYGYGRTYMANIYLTF